MRTHFGWMLVAVSMAAGPGVVQAAPLPTTGTISIVADASDDAEPLTAFIEALDSQLSAKGFTVLKTPGHAALAAHVHVTRSDRGVVSAKTSRGGASSGSVGLGTGVSLPFGRTGSHDVSLRQTRLDIGISQRGDDRIVWQATATTVRPADGRRGGDEAVAQDLTEAALRAFPGQTGHIVSVP